MILLSNINIKLQIMNDKLFSINFIYSNNNNKTLNNKYNLN